jgi:hypothetical protein
MIVRPSDQTPIALECGGLTPFFERKYRVGMFNFTDSIVINASAL